MIDSAPNASVGPRSLSNSNGAERSLRAIEIGRKNWNFYGIDEGAWTAAFWRASSQRANVSVRIRLSTCPTYCSASAHILRTTSTNCCLASGKLLGHSLYSNPDPARLCDYPHGEKESGMGSPDG
jgi:hypothetical protein